MASLEFIADIAANHDGDINRAFKLIELAKESGATAAKFQHFQAETIVDGDAFEKLDIQTHQSRWKESVYQVYKKASLDMSWTEALKAKCDEYEIEFMTSPYSVEIVEEVDKYLRCYKIGSGDITYKTLLDHIASKGKPVYLATGASTMEEVEDAFNLLNKKVDVVLMQCNTNYTGSVDNFKHINLRVLLEFAQKFPGIRLGLSDHTPGCATAVAAVGLGATVIEKHFTDDKSRVGPDHSFSLTPSEWRLMVDSSQQALEALGDGRKVVEDNEINSRVVQRRGARYTKELKVGDIVNRSMISFLRPAPPGAMTDFDVDEILGKEITRSVLSGELVLNEHFS